MVWDEALPFILGAVWPSFLQNESNRRQQLSAGPTFDPQQQQTPQSNPAFGMSPQTNPEMFPQTDYQQRVEMYKKMGPYSTPPIVEDPAWNDAQRQQGVYGGGGGQGGIWPLIYGRTGASSTPDSSMPQQSPQQPPAPAPQQQTSNGGGYQYPTQPQQQAPQQGQQRGMWDVPVLNQIDKIMGSPLGMGGMGALGAMMLTPKWAGAKGALGAALMGGMQGYERGSNIQNAQAQTQSTTDYYRQQAEYERQRIALEQQKQAQKAIEDAQYNTIWNAMSPEEQKRVIMGRQANPNEWTVLEQAFPGDPARQLEEHRKMQRASGQTSFGSYTAEMEGKNIPYGSPEFNAEFEKRQRERQENAPSNVRADKREARETQQQTVNNKEKWQRRLDAYKKSEEYVLADEKDKPRLLSAQRKKIWKDLGLPGEPPAEEKAERPSLDEIFGKGPGGK